MAKPNLYKIHPAIGIARLGDADKYFIGPETPGLRPTGEKPGVAVPPYKDADKIKPQAARFRIFEYVDKGGKYEVSRELPLMGKDVQVIWSVHLANRKASFFRFEGMQGEDRAHAKGRRNAAVPVADRKKLEIDPLERKLPVTSKAKTVHFNKSAKPAGQLWPTPPPVPDITTLGRMTHDADGRLIVIGGKGIVGSSPGAGAIKEYANNDGWFDDVCDGYVAVELRIKGVHTVVMPAWLIVAPPDFAPHLTNMVSLYDRLYDVAARELVLPASEATYITGALKALGEVNAEFKKNGGPVLRNYKPDFNDEIYPILFRALASSFVFGPSVGHHGLVGLWATLSDPSPTVMAVRHAVFDRLRKPGTPGTASISDMPKLLGDEPYQIGGAFHKNVRLTLTETHYAILSQWADGHFAKPATTPPVPPSAPKITPEGLDKAALENCVGGAFFPGIEVGWLIRNRLVYVEPFRIFPGTASTFIGDAGQLVRPGYFSRQMALPWTADFLQCKKETVAGGPLSGDWGWWPAQRPDMVFASEADFKAGKPSVPWHRASKAGATTNWSTGFKGDLSTPSYDEMIANWKKFGFIVEKSPGIFVESERKPDIP